MPSESERPKLSRRRKPKEEDVEAFVSGAAGTEEGQESRSRKPPADTVRFNANLPEGLHKRLKMRAVEEGRTMTDVAIEAISNYLSDK